MQFGESDIVISLSLSHNNITMSYWDVSGLTSFLLRDVIIASL